MSELLDLSTIVDRDTVRIRTKKNPAGKVYDLLNPEELGAFEHAVIAARHRKLADLHARTDRKLTPAEVRAFTKGVKDVLAQIVVGIEPQVLAELERTQAEKIVLHWVLKHQADDLPGAAEGEDQASLSTTAGSSQDSKRSTAATRGTGSTSRGGR